MSWVLIIVILGWGGGTGSKGNAAVAADFFTKERCEAAAAALDQAYRATSENQTRSSFRVDKTFIAACFQK